MTRIRRPLVSTCIWAIALTAIAILAGSSAEATQSSAIVANSTAKTISVVDLSTLTVTVTRVVEVGPSPEAVAIAPGTNHRAFVVLTSLGRVEVLTTDTLELVATIAVESEPYSIAISPNGLVAYVSNNASSSVSVISVTSATLIRHIPVQSGPRGMAFSKDGRFLYVANSASGSISVIATATNAVVDTISVTDYPQDVVASQDGQFLLVLSDTNRVDVLSLQFGTRLRSITLSGNGIAMTLSPNGATVYVATAAGTIDTIDVANLATAGAFSGIGGAGSVALSDTGITGYATDSSGGRLIAFDPTVLTQSNALAMTAGTSAIAVPPPIVPVNGWWWSPAESGRGYGLEAKNGKIFVSTYLYQDDGTPIWYLANGSRTTTGFSNTLNQYGNGQSLLGSYRAAQWIAGVSPFSLTFTTPTTATLTWAGSTTSIERYDIVSGGSAAGPVGGMPETGWWWNESESGRGFIVEVQGNKLFFSGYMYDDAGVATWYISTGDMTSTSLYSGTLQRCSGGQSLTGSYRAPGCTADQGSVTLQFTSQIAATMTLPSGRQIPLARFSNF